MGRAGPSGEIRLKEVQEVLKSHFSLTEVLGEGVSGVVFGGHRLQDGLPVAIKVVKPAFLAHPKARERIEREVAILKRLRHPNLIRLYGAGRIGELPFLALERVDGASLEDIFGRDLPERPELFHWLLGAARGMREVHRAGILHRDLKPDNILVDDSGLARVVDFGLAGGESFEQLTRTGAFVGTPVYMAPEQFTEGKVSPVSDVYGWAAVFYRGLVGDPPQRARNLSDLLSQKLDPVLEIPAEPSLPEWFTQGLCTCLDPDPKVRPDFESLVPWLESRGRRALSNQDKSSSAPPLSRPRGPLAPPNPSPPPPESSSPPAPSVAGPELAGSIPPPSRRFPLWMGVFLVGLLGSLAWEFGPPVPALGSSRAPSFDFEGFQPRVGFQVRPTLGGLEISIPKPRPEETLFWLRAKGRDPRRIAVRPQTLSRTLLWGEGGLPETVEVGVLDNESDRVPKRLTQVRLGPIRIDAETTWGFFPKHHLGSVGNRLWMARKGPVLERWELGLGQEPSSQIHPPPTGFPRLWGRARLGRDQLFLIWGRASGPGALVESLGNEGEPRRYPIPRWRPRIGHFFASSSTQLLFQATRSGAGSLAILELESGEVQSLDLPQGKAASSPGGLGPTGFFGVYSQDEEDRTEQRSLVWFPRIGGELRTAREIASGRGEGYESLSRALAVDPETGKVALVWKDNLWILDPRGLDLRELPGSLLDLEGTRSLRRISRANFLSRTGNDPAMTWVGEDLYSASWSGEGEKRFFDTEFMTLYRSDARGLKFLRKPLDLKGLGADRTPVDLGRAPGAKISFDPALGYGVAVFENINFGSAVVFFDAELEILHQLFFPIEDRSRLARGTPELSPFGAVVGQSSQLVWYVPFWRGWKESPR